MGPRLFAPRQRAAAGFAAVLAVCAGAPASFAQEGPLVRFVGGAIAPPRQAPGPFRPGLTLHEKNPRRHLVQIDGELTPRKREMLEDAGVEIEGYYPSRAFLLRPTGDSAAAIARLPFVRWIGDYDWRNKIDPNIGRTGARFAHLALRGMTAFDVTLYEGESHAGVERLALQAGGEVLGALGTEGATTLRVVAPTGAAPVFARLASVRFIEETPRFEPRVATTRWIVQSAVPDFTPLYSAGLTGAGQIVGVVDDGIDIDHCAFDDPLNPVVPGAAGVDPTRRKIVAYNESAISPTFHGTLVTGILAGDNGAFDDNRGVAYEAQVVFQRFPSAGEIVFPSDAVKETAMVNLFQLHHDQGARVHTNSWGLSDLDQDVYNGVPRGVDVFTRANEDDLVVFATANTAFLQIPENAKNALAVAGAQDFPNTDLQRIGAIGPTSDGRRKPEVLAPAFATGPRSNLNATSPSCGATLNGPGTSFAAPAVAGVATLAREYFMEGFYPTGAPVAVDALTPTGALLKAAVVNAAVNMAREPDANFDTYPSNVEGWGLVQMDGALHFAGEARTLRLFDVRHADATALTLGALNEHVVSVTSSDEPLKITLAWTDAPGTLGSAAPWVNDIDLEVKAPDGTVYLGNVFDEIARESVAGGAPDERNNLEQIHVSAPQVGPWRISVIGARGFGLPEFATQGYALVATGALEDGPDCVGDVNGDGRVGPVDLAMLLANWRQPGASDFNNSGDTDPVDLAILLMNWRGCD